MCREWGPYAIDANSFQDAWVAASAYILANNCEARNIIVKVRDIFCFNDELHAAYDRFCRSQNILRPKQVAYTIFPEGLTKGRDSKGIFRIYNRGGGFYERIKTGWGTYFGRLTHYSTDKGIVNQLDKIIEALKKDRLSGVTRRAAYSVLIHVPGGETVKPLGKPCLNYLAIQGLKDEPPCIGMLAIYRNQDFIERAYGNYQGLVQLLQFICKEADYTAGPLTCLSSHAYIDRKIRAFRTFLDNMK